MQLQSLGKACLKLSAGMLLGLLAATAWCQHADAMDYRSMGENRASYDSDLLPSDLRIDSDVRGFSVLGFGAHEERPRDPYEIESAMDGGTVKAGRGMSYGLSEESAGIPALAVSAYSGQAIDYFGKGIEREFKLMASKTIGGGTNLQRVHLNISWKYNDESGKKREPEDSYVAVVGYDYDIGPDVVVILDFVHEFGMDSSDKQEDGEGFGFAELGLRYSVTPLTVLSIGAGSSIAEDSPEFRTSIGFRHSF